MILAAGFNVWNLVTSLVALGCAGIAAFATVRSTTKSAETTKQSEEAARTWNAMSELLQHEREERQSETGRRQDAEDRLQRAEERAEERVRAAEARIEQLQSAFEHQIHRLGSEMAELENRLRECREEARAANAELIMIRGILRTEVVDAAVETSGADRDEIEAMMDDPTKGTHDG